MLNPLAKYNIFVSNAECIVYYRIDETLLYCWPKYRLHWQIFCLGKIGRVSQYCNNALKSIFEHPFWCFDFPINKENDEYLLGCAFNISFCIHCKSLYSIALYGLARFQLMFWLQSHKWESFVLACSTNNFPLMLTVDSSCFTLINADADWGFCFEKAKRCVGLVGCGRNSSLSELC